MTKLHEEIIQVIKIFNYPNQNVRALAELINQRRKFHNESPLVEATIIKSFDELCNLTDLPENLKSPIKQIYNYGR